jgi:nitrous oxidase accessory protein NosD
MFSATGLIATLAALALGVSTITEDAFSAPAASGGPTIIVAADGSADFTTISEAVAAAADGDTILVRPGTYSESIVIDKDISLTGEGAAEDIIIRFEAAGPKRTYTFESGGQPEEFSAAVGLELSATAPSVRNLTLSSPPEGFAVVVTGGSPTLEGLRIVRQGSESATPDVGYVAFLFLGQSSPTLRDSAWDGYTAIRDGSSATIEDSTITGETVSIDGPGESNVRGSTFVGGSISASAGAKGTIEDNDFSGGGIGVDTGSSMVIRGNTIRDVKGPAVDVRDEGTSVTVEENTITGSMTGVAVRPGTAATITGNSLIDNGLGVSLGSGDATASDNSVESGDAGLWVNAGAPTLSGNTVLGMKTTGIAIMAPASPVLSGNTSCDNGTNLVVADGATPVIDDTNEICEDAPAG